MFCLVKYVLCVYLMCLWCRSSMFCVSNRCVCDVGPVCSVCLLDVFVV